jgi:hypothetical protein
MKTITLTVAVLYLLAMAGVVGADDYYWDEPVGGDYGTADNWSPSGPPGSSDDAYFELDDIYTVTFDNNYAVEKMRADAGEVAFDLDGNGR